MFLLALPAGALADIVDKRRFLIGGETFITATCAVLAAYYLARPHHPAHAPALHFSHPGRLGRDHSRLASGRAGARSARRSLFRRGDEQRRRQCQPRRRARPRRADHRRASGSLLPSGSMRSATWAWSGQWDGGARRGSERLSFPRSASHSAIRAGVRHARNNPQLRATLVRAVRILPLRQLLLGAPPLVARSQIGGGPTIYGILLGIIGASATAGAVALPWLKERLGPDRLVSAGSIATALAMVLLGAATP